MSDEKNHDLNLKRAGLVLSAVGLLVTISFYVHQCHSDPKAGRKSAEHSESLQRERELWKQELAYCEELSEAVAKVSARAGSGKPVDYEVWLESYIRLSKVISEPAVRDSLELLQLDIVGFVEDRPNSLGGLSPELRVVRGGEVVQDALNQVRASLQKDLADSSK